MLMLRYARHPWRLPFCRPLLDMLTPLFTLPLAAFISMPFAYGLAVSPTEAVSSHGLAVITFRAADGYALLR